MVIERFDNEPTTWMESTPIGAWGLGLKNVDENGLG